MAFNIGKFIAKGAGIARDGLGTVNALKDTLKPFLPPGLVKAIDRFLGFVDAPDSLSDINKFRSTISAKNGLLRTNKFYVEIGPPPMMAGAGNEVAKIIPFLTEATNVPGMSLATSEIRRYGYGPIERKPYAPVFTDQTFTFLGDGTGQVHQFFYSWMNGIVKSDRMPYSSFGVGYNGLRPFEVEYKSEYATDIRITVLDEANKKVIVVILHEAYPIFMGDTALSWADNDNIMRFPVTFTFFNWSLEEIDLSGLLDSGGGGNLSLLQRILKVGSAIQTISSIRKPTGVADVINIVNNSKIAIGGLTGIFS
jgi:hypothetical protein